MKNKRELRQKRKLSIRKTVLGSTEKPRLSVFRSNKHLFAQLIDDCKHVTLVGVSDKKNIKGAKKSASAVDLGKEFAKLAIAKGVKQAVFDRNGYKFHGRIKAFAEAVKEAGINI